MTGSDNKADPDQLISSGISSSTELTDSELDGAVGGETKGVIRDDPIPVKSKTADKAFNAMDSYIRG